MKIDIGYTIKKSHMEGDVKVIDDIEVIDFAFITPKISGN